MNASSSAGQDPSLQKANASQPDVFHLPSFRDDRLLDQALTHRSYANEHPEEGDHNERLEFLGDAVLNFISGEFLFKRYPDKPEGELTALRSALVDEAQLATFAQALGLGDRLKLGQGAQKQGGRQNANLMSCAFEAVVGAYFLDQESESEAVWDWVIPLFEAVMEELAIATPQSNAKSRLQEWAQQQFQQTPVYKVVAASGPDHDKQFRVEVWVKGHRLGVGRGKRKQDAEKAAAADAIGHRDAIEQTDSVG